MKCTIGRIFEKTTAAEGSLTPFQAVCTALADTVGTGNIAGVAGAIAIGGVKRIGKVSEKLVPLMALIYIVLGVGLIWGISDTFNGFMTVPNLIAVFLLTPEILKLIKKHFARES